MQFLTPEAIAAYTTILLGAASAWSKSRQYLRRFLLATARPLFKGIARMLVGEDPRIEHLHDKLELILQEIRPNGGTSLRDAINRIELNSAHMRERQTAFFNYQDVAVFEADAKGLWTWANRGFLNLVQMSLDELQGRGWVNSIAPESRAFVEKEWSDCVAEDRAFSAEYFIRRDDETIKVFAVAHPLRSQGKLIGFLGFVRVSDSAVSK